MLFFLTINDSTYKSAWCKLRQNYGSIFYNFIYRETQFTLELENLIPVFWDCINEILESRNWSQDFANKKFFIIIFFSWITKCSTLLEMVIYIECSLHFRINIGHVWTFLTLCNVSQCHFKLIKQKTFRNIIYTYFYFGDFLFIYLWKIHKIQDHFKEWLKLFTRASLKGVVANILWAYVNKA